MLFKSTQTAKAGPNLPLPSSNPSRALSPDRRARPKPAYKKCRKLGKLAE